MCRFAFKSASCWALVLLLLVTHCFADVSENEILAKAAALSRGGKAQKAEAVLRSGIAAHPDSAVLHGSLGKLLFHHRKYEAAVQELGLAAQGLPDSRAYNFLLAEALIGWTHFTVAVDFLNAVRPRFGNEAQFHYDLGLAYYNLNKMTLAQQELEEALQLKASLDPARYVLGGCLLASGDSAGALREYRRLVRERPGKAIYWAGLAQTLRTTGFEAEALQAVQRALSLAPHDTHVQYVAATVFTESGNFAKARVYWERLEKLDPNILAVHVQLARVYTRLGQRELAHKETDIVNELRARNSSEVSPAGDQQVSPRP